MRLRRSGSAAGPQLWIAALATLSSGVLTLIATAATTTSATFIAVTDNAGDSWQSGRVLLTDDDGGSAAFSTSANGALSAGQTLTRCIAVTYEGSWFGATVGDDFTTKDTTKWNWSNPNVAHSAGAVEITPTTEFPSIFTGARYDLRNSSAQVEVLQTASGTSTTYLSATFDANNQAQVSKSGTNLHATERIAGVISRTSIPWDAAAMRFWRIALAGGNLLWQYSADAATWTTFRSKAPGFPVDSVKFGFIAGYSGTEPSPGTARFDNFVHTPNTGIRMHGSANGALAPYLDLTIERGAGGSATDCTGFTSESTIYTGTLSHFASTANSYAAGVGGWAPSATPATKTYRLTVRVSSDPAAASSTADATFTWETQTG